MKTVLIVEDDLIIRLHLGRFIELEGHKLLEAERGDDGIRLAAEHHPDLIFCDMMMPGADGLTVLAAVRADPATQNTPFFLLSATVEQDKREQALAQGATGYITKPFTLADLRQVFQTALG